jgi:hypothetical protein
VLILLDLIDDSLALVQVPADGDWRGSGMAEISAPGAQRNCSRAGLCADRSDHGAPEMGTSGRKRWPSPTT